MLDDLCNINECKAVNLSTLPPLDLEYSLNECSVSKWYHYPALIYIADMETHELLWVNKKMKDEYHEDAVGKKCYYVLQNLKEPCAFCTNFIIQQMQPKPYQWIWKNEITGKSYLVTDKVVLWNDKKVRLEKAIDITEYKEDIHG